MHSARQQRDFPFSPFRGGFACSSALIPPLTTFRTKTFCIERIMVWVTGSAKPSSKRKSGSWQH